MGMGNILREKKCNGLSVQRRKCLHTVSVLVNPLKSNTGVGMCRYTQYDFARLVIRLPVLSVINY